jgi:hypothetical protein
MQLTLIPGALCEASDIGYQYGAFSEHLMMSVCDIFSDGEKFPRMTEIILGNEACSTSFKMKNKYGQCISIAIFKGIGVSCPNLKVLDLTLCTTINGENLLFLFFHDTYGTLHKFVHLPQIGTDHGAQEDKVSFYFD